MKIVAVAPIGQEFVYKANTAHKVRCSAKKICETLNTAKYKIAEDEHWWTYEIDEYSKAYQFAVCQSFKLYKGNVLERSHFRGIAVFVAP